MLVLHAAKRYDEVIGVRDSDEIAVAKVDHAATHAEVGALCNAAKYIAAEAAFEACERAGKILLRLAVFNLAYDSQF